MCYFCVGGDCTSLTKLYYPTQIKTIQKIQLNKDDNIHISKALKSNGKTNEQTSVETE